MELIHPDIPELVQRTFAYDLQRSTLKDLQPQIADAIGGFLREINQECKVDRAQASSKDESDEDEAQVHRTFATGRGNSRGRPFQSRQPPFHRNKTPNRGAVAKYPASKSSKQCIVCKLTAKRYDHALAECYQVCDAAIRSLTVDDTDPSDHDLTIDE